MLGSRKRWAKRATRGMYLVVAADRPGYLDNFQRDPRMEWVKKRSSDRRVLKLMRPW